LSLPDDSRSDLPKHVARWNKSEGARVRVLCFAWICTVDIGDRGNTLSRNVGTYKQTSKALHLGRLAFSR